MPAARPRREEILTHCHRFDKTRNMKILDAVDRLAALGHSSRLAIFRLLVQAGDEGLSAGVIGEKLDLPPATLSFHLAHLSRVGLIAGRQQSRFIFYAADYEAMDELIAYLTDNCCGGKVCLPKTAGAASAARVRRRSKTTS